MVRGYRLDWDVGQLFVHELAFGSGDLIFIDRHTIHSRYRWR